MKHLPSLSDVNFGSLNGNLNTKIYYSFLCICAARRAPPPSIVDSGSTPEGVLCGCHSFPRAERIFDPRFLITISSLFSSDLVSEILPHICICHFVGLY